ncbi:MULTISPECIES: DUF2919 domain-containing protein [Ferrimonas]|uniref:DUF2919 domain-containing protein n=1 Tax=Ferrimonas TaxID=44011 RepID=UPI00041ED676|nr:MULTISPECIES: DUF2919 domain-containing protein [Ferrimonas]USD39281.1 DUF2919 domain-containing protein [Ferrimonas sp. SCSIO 43195]
MTYPIYAFNQHGDLKPPLWLFVLMAFLGRTWLLMAIAAASRSTGSDILALFYPSTHYFYLGLLSGLPVVLLTILGRFKGGDRQWIKRVWQQGKWILMANWLLDLVLQASALHHQRGDVALYQALPLLASFWFGWYLIKSRRIGHYFDGAHVLSHTKVRS